MTREYVLEVLFCPRLDGKPLFGAECEQGKDSDPRTERLVRRGLPYGRAVHLARQKEQEMARAATGGAKKRKGAKVGRRNPGV